jgi:WD40 repeat protein
MSSRLPRPSPSAVLRGHSAGVTSLAFLAAPVVPAHACRLAAGDASGALVIWDTHVEEAVLTLAPLHASPLVSIAQEPATAALYLQHKGGPVRCVDLSHNPFAPADKVLTLASDRALPRGRDSFCAITFIRPYVMAGPAASEGAGEASVAVLRDCRVGVDVPVACSFGSEKRTGPRGMLMCVEPLAGTRGLLAAGYEDGSVSVWDERMPEEAVSTVSVCSNVVLALAACPLGGGVVSVGFAANSGGSGGGPGLAAVCDGRVVAGGREMSKSKDDCGERGNGVACVRWRLDGKMIATGGWDGRVRVWDGRRKASLLRPLGSLRWHEVEGGVDALAFADDAGGLLASGGKDRTIALWRL